MRIVLCNKYFFLNGGTERYLQSLLRALPLQGHEAVPFSVAYAGSWPSEYARFFLPSPGREGATHYRDLRPGPLALLRHAERSLYSFEARRCLTRLLTHLGGADVGYLLNIYNYMSPSIVHGFRRRGIPVVLRLGDYHPLCANYTLLRENRPCTLCVAGSYRHGLVHRCVKGSLAASALRVCSMYLQRWLGLYTGVDAVIAPCSFMAGMLVRGGFPESRIHVVRQPAFSTLGEGELGPVSKQRSVVYFGRISREKGLDTLIEAYQRLDTDAPLFIVGRSYDGCVEELQALIRPEFRDRIRFPGFLQGRELAELVAGAQVSVVPSRWYDNAPLAVYESYLLGTPVLGAAIGGIPEQILPGETGLLFAPDDVEDLAARLGALLADPEGCAAMGRRARDYAREQLGLERHLEQLLGIFETLPHRGRP